MKCSLFVTRRDNLSGGSPVPENDNTQEYCVQLLRGSYQGSGRCRYSGPRSIFSLVNPGGVRKTQSWRRPPGVVHTKVFRRSSATVCYSILLVTWWVTGVWKVDSETWTSWPQYTVETSTVLLKGTTVGGPKETGKGSTSVPTTLVERSSRVK